LRSRKAPLFFTQLSENHLFLKTGQKIPNKFNNLETPNLQNFPEATNPWLMLKSAKIKDSGQS